MNQSPFSWAAALALLCLGVRNEARLEAAAAGVVPHANLARGVRVLEQGARPRVRL